jgi:uncharacterized surface anchored protein
MALYVTAMFEYALSKNNQVLYTAEKLLSMDDIEKYMALADIDRVYAVSLQKAYEAMESYSTQSLGKVYVFTGPTGYQRLATLYIGMYTGEEPEPEPVKPEYNEVSATQSRSSQRKHQVILDHKYASVTGESLAGAVFAVYEDDRFKGNITTDAQGRGTLSWNVESLGSASVSKTYCINDADLDEETRASLNCYRSREEAYAAAEAEAAALAQEQADRAADTSRTVRLRETTIPVGFSDIGQSEYSGSIAGEGSLTFRVENRPWRARVTLDKIDGMTGERLPGAAQFAVLEWNGNTYVSTDYQMIRRSDGIYTVKSSKSGAETGYLYYTQKNTGKFCIRETKAPGGYIQDTDSVYIQITGDNQEIRIGNANPKKYAVQEKEKFSNQPWRARVTLDKVDGLTGGRLTGAAKFTVLEWNGSAYAGSDYQMIRLSDGTYTIQNSKIGADTGYVYYTQKNEGKFCIQETKAPEGYLQDADPVYLQITSNNQEIRLGNANPKKYAVKNETQFANQPWKAKVILDKVDGLTGDRLAGAAEFTIQEWNGSTYETSADYRMVRLADGTYTVKSQRENTETGYVYYTEKNAGKFRIQEIKAPGGYLRDTDLVSFRIMQDGQVIRLGNADPEKYAVQNGEKFANQPWKARVILDKVDAQTGSRLTKETQFTVLEWNGNSYEVSAAYSMIRLTDGTYTVKGRRENAEIGYLYYTEKNAGKFGIQEEKAPDGYQMDELPVYFQITHNGQTIRPSNADSENDAVQNRGKFANQPAYVRIRIPKTDRYSKNLIAENAHFGVYDEGGNLLSGVFFQKEPDGSYLSSEIYYADTTTYANYGRFYVVEEKAPRGYRGDWDEEAAGDLQRQKNQYAFCVEASLKNHGQVLSVTNDSTGKTFYNEPVYGQVILYKRDSEAQAEENGNPITQGDTKTLDGAVYGLYAAEEITHPDGVTGILYHKDELADQAVIGWTPLADHRGWLLDEDGRRCMESGKVAAGEPTPGQTAFMQIVPGRYYIKEMIPPNGYLSDTTVYRGEELTRYDVTICYGSEADEVLLRTEKSGQDKNSLTVDDAGAGHEIYSGDFVKKQAVQFIKLLNRNTNTEAVPAAGAGFSLYRLEELSGVAKGELSPDSDQWTSLDMKKFLLYDFTGEETARLYKRQSEPWTEADRKWLTATGARENEYQIREMFSDANGYFCTPELPAGQYILVETTVPDGKRMASPVLVTITKDSAMAQPIRYIGNDTTEVYIRIQKTDRDSREDGYHTVYKPGASYRIRLLSGKEDFDSTLWHVDSDGFLWYYNAHLRMTCGTKENPFAVTCVYQDGKIADAYVELEPLLPVGRYELIETSAPEGYVINGKEQTLTDCSEEGTNRYLMVDSPKKPLTFEISNAVVFPDGQMGEGKNGYIDAYGRQILVVEQENQEQKGLVEIYKTGEQLYAVESTDVSLADKLGDIPFCSLMKREEFTAADQNFIYQKAPVAGAVFEIYAAEDIYTQQLQRELLDYYVDDIRCFLVWEKDQPVGRITTDTSGYGYLAGLYIGSYYIKEVTAGDGFVRNDQVEFFTVTAAEPSQSILVYESHYENERQKVKIAAVKQDAERETALAGAVFGLYNTEEILSEIVYDAASDSYQAALESRRLVTAGTLLATAVSGADGTARFEIDLPLGRYEIRELAAPLGYVSPEPSLCIPIDASYKDQETSVQVYGGPEGVLFSNQKTKHMFTKTDFTSGAFLNGAVLEVREIVLDQSGNPIKDSQGRYETILVESWVSDREEIHYFYEEKMGEDTSGAANTILTEITSPKELPEGKTLHVRNGHLIEGLKEGGQYIFREITAPTGYVGYLWSDEEVRNACREENKITEEIRFTAAAGQNGVTFHEMKNQRVSGTILLTKEGEVLTSTSVSVWDSLQGFFETVFGYVTGKVAKARFEVRVREEIYEPDESGAIAVYDNGEEKVELYQDSLVAVIASGADGYARLEGLPLGSYYITEVGAGEGDFVLSDRIAEVTLAYAGQKVSVVVQDQETYTNERQRVSLSVVKRAGSVEGKEGETSMEGLPGAVFGLYNREAIYGFDVDPMTGQVTENPEALLAENTLLERISTGLDGTARFASDLPCGRYYLRELDAPCGYLLSEEEIEIDASYQGQDAETVQNFSVDFFDTPVLVRISKVSAIDGFALSGALLQIRDLEGNVVEEWTTDGLVHTISGLRTGKTYVLSERMPAAGFATARDIEFVPMQKRGEDGRLLQETEIWIKTHEEKYPPEDGQTEQLSGESAEFLGWMEAEEIIMVDQPIQVLISKTDITTAEPVEGAKLTIRSESGEWMESWITGTEPYLIKKLPTGRYILTEESVPKESGYSLAKEISFEVKDTEEIQHVGIQNDYIRLRVCKISAQTKKLLPGAVLLLEFLPENEDPVLIEQFVTTAEEKIFTGLQPGSYRLTEIEAPNGFFAAEPIMFTVTQDNEIQEVIMEDEPLPPPPRHEETTPNETPPEETPPQETTPEETSPQETTPEETTPEETSSQGTAPEETPSEETISEETTSQETTPEETTPQEATSRETIPEETTPEETLPEETTGITMEETVSQETMPRETTAQKTIPEETTKEISLAEPLSPGSGYGDGGGDTGDSKAILAGILSVSLGLALLIPAFVSFLEKEKKEED